MVACRFFPRHSCKLRLLTYYLICEWKYTYTLTHNIASSIYMSIGTMRVANFERDTLSIIMPSLWLILFLLVSCNSFSSLCHLMNYFLTLLRASIIVFNTNTFFLSSLSFARIQFDEASPAISFSQRLLFISMYYSYYLFYFLI